jgi:hypothetical protein
MLIGIPCWGFDHTREADGRAAPAARFDQLWVVDRNLPDLFEVLAAITRPERFDAIVLTAADSSRVEVVNQLLEFAPPGTIHWVSRDPVPVGMSVDRIPDPRDLIAAGRGDAVVVCADESMAPLAALVALRTDGSFHTSMPDAPASVIIQIGGDAPQWIGGPGARITHLGRVEAVHDFLNARATRTAVLVYAAGHLLPEHVLLAFQRGLLLIEVDPPPFSGDDVASEIQATMATAAQIRTAVAQMRELQGVLPEALVIAGDWTRIPYRFARSTDPDLVGCDGCDNGILTFSSDAEYANFDADPWGEPEVATGRIMSYDRDLLAVQTVIGVWHDHGAFEPAPRATFLGVFPSSLRDLMVTRWRDAVWDRQWEVFGPRNADDSEDFAFDTDDFLRVADDSDVVVVQAHGAPNEIRGDRRLLDGEILASTAHRARPAFWFSSACATARHIPEPTFGTSPLGNGNLMSGLQSRAILGALLTVELNASAAGNLVWIPAELERGTSIGELVRRAWVDGISAYRGDPDAPEIPDGLSHRKGTDLDLKNAWMPHLWVGDPLTVF